MGKKASNPLSRRERQIMDVVYELGECSARDVHSMLDDPPSYSSIRALMSILVEKGHLVFRQHGARYLYLPATPLEVAQRGAVRRLIKTFFSGSVSDAVSALLGSDSQNLTDEELDALSKMVDKARRQRKEH